MSERHEMKMVKEYHLGWQWWKCPLCSAERVIRWEPSEHIVLDWGDMDANHSGSGGFSEVEVNVSVSQDADVELPNWLEDAIDGLGL